MASRRLIPKIKFLILFALTVLTLTSLADHFVLTAIVPPARQKGLLFPPGSSFPYQTPEFSHTVTINSLGFRDREWQEEKSGSTVRVLAIGDSFTFGMGVELEQTWVKVLETKLRGRGHRVDIANLGKPGADPASYVETAIKAVPLLKPDIILVAILQGDDLAQTLLRIRKEGTTKGTRNRAAHATSAFDLVVRFLYPRSMEILGEWSGTRATFKSRDRLLEKIWQEQAREMVSGFTDEQRGRFDSMGAAARTMFLSGQLNPGIVSMAMADPHYFLTPLHTDDPSVRRALNQLGSYLRSIQTAAEDAPVVVVSIPLGTYVSKNAWQGSAEIGFMTVPEMLLTTAPDDSLSQICAEAGIPFHSVTEEFRRQRGRELLYYKHDGHFTAQGHEFFADRMLLFLEMQFFKGTSSNDLNSTLHGGET